MLFFVQVESIQALDRERQLEEVQWPIPQQALAHCSTSLLRAL